MRLASCEKGRVDVAQDLQPTRLQKSLYPDHTRLFGALCALGQGSVILCRAHRGERGAACLTLTPAVDTRLSGRAGTQMPIHHRREPHLTHLGTQMRIYIKTM